MKKFYRILKTNEEVQLFENNFKQIEATFSAIRESRTNLMLKNDLDNLETLSEGFQKKLEKFVGICRSSQTYARNHKDTDSLLSEESIAILSGIQKKVAEELGNNEFALEQLRDRREFEALAKGTPVQPDSQSEAEPKGGE